MYHSIYTAAMLLVMVGGSLGAPPTQHKATPFLTSKTSPFGALIEAVSVNTLGEVFATDFTLRDTAGAILPGHEGTVGKVDTGTFYFKSPDPASHVNGIRFYSESSFIFADVRKHQAMAVMNVVPKGPSSSTAETWGMCGQKKMLQPNDLARSFATGNLYLTGMDQPNNRGDLWICEMHWNGSFPEQALISDALEPTNGVELSPCEDYLYVSQVTMVGGKTATRARILRIPLDAKTGRPTSKGPWPVWVDFDALDGSGGQDVDGMRTDIHGNLYVTRFGGKGGVMQLSPSGKILRYISTSFIVPTNLDLGGPEGRTLNIAGACVDDGSVGCVDRWEAPFAGRAWAELNGHDVCALSKNYSQTKQTE